MDIKDIIELSKNGFTPADIKDLITTMNEQKQEIAQEANTEIREFPAEKEVEFVTSTSTEDKTQDLIDAIKDLKKSIQASNIRKDTGAPQAQSVEDILASLVN